LSAAARLSEALASTSITIFGDDTELNWAVCQALSKRIGAAGSRAIKHMSCQTQWSKHILWLCNQAGIRSGYQLAAAV
jgi:hypothetical protein